MAHIAFDLNGTLLDPAGASARLQAALPKAIQLAMAHDLAGDFRPLAELLEAIDPELDPAEATRMPAFPDVEEGLDLLRDAGHTLAVLTNSAAGTAERALEHAGLRDRFAAVASAEEAGVHKPHPRAYAHGREALGGIDLFVAAHAWDTFGARSAGLRTALVERSGSGPADLRAADLPGIARALTG